VCPFFPFLAVINHSNSHNAFDVLFRRQREEGVHAQGTIKSAAAAHSGTRPLSTDFLAAIVTKRLLCTYLLRLLILLSVFFVRFVTAA